MALKSFRLKVKKTKSKKKKRTSGIIGTGITAILGVALFSETARAVNRI